MWVRTRISEGAEAFGLGFGDGGGDFGGIVAIGHLRRVPAISVETPAHVFGEDQASGAGQRNVVLS